MKKYMTIFAGVALSVLLSTAAVAGSSDTATITLEVKAINEINIDNDVSMTIDTATAGSEPTDATGASTYDITTNGQDKKITAQLDQNMPSDTTLSLTAKAPIGGISAVNVVLDSSAKPAVTHITKVAASDLPLAFTFSAEVTAGVLPSFTRILTLTLTDS